MPESSSRLPSQLELLPPTPSAATPDPEDLSPTEHYLAELARGVPQDVALKRAGNPGLRVARATPEFSRLEAILQTAWGSGQGRPAIAKALLAHESLSSVLRLVTIAETAEFPRDRIQADRTLLEYGPIAPAKNGAQSQAQQIVLSISIGGATPVVVDVTPSTPKPEAKA